MAYVGNAPRQVEGLSGQQDGARAAGNDGPLVLTGARLFDARGRTTHTMARASPRLGARPPAPSPTSAPARRRPPRRRAGGDAAGAPSQPWSPVCVVNGRLRQADKDAFRRAPRCVVSRVGFCVLQTSSAWVSAVRRTRPTWRFVVQRYRPSSACDPRRTRRRVSAPDFW